LFVDALKGVAFEWFMKLPADSTKIWIDREKLFLAHLFEDNLEISVLTLLGVKQKKGESIKIFIERFRSMALHCPTGIIQSIVVETCHHNP